MSSNNINLCTFCLKECKISDSRPYPSSKSKDRIHFKCHIKKSLYDKQKKCSPSDNTPHEKSSMKTKSSFDVMNKLIREEETQKKTTNDTKVNKFIEDQVKQAAKKESTFFFDVKAGIAKPHEKKRYLSHRNVSEMAARYDDQGFQEDAIGRAFDHHGNDVKNLDDTNDLGTDSCGNPGSSSESKIERKSRRSNDIDRESHEVPKKPGLKRSSKLGAIRLNESNPCWFCLSSPNVEKHLIVAIGDQCYLSLAKGGLVDEHFLIIPIEHIQSSTSAENSKDLLDEVENFKRSIINYFKDQSLGVVFFERNFRSVHWQLQAVPISSDIMDGLYKRIATISKKYYETSNYINIPEGCSVNDVIPPRAPYFYWQLEPIGTRLVFQLEIKGKDSYFPIQFGREVLADEGLMNCPDRINWKNCSKSVEEYVKLVKLIKIKYEPYDPTN